MDKPKFVTFALNADRAGSVVLRISQIESIEQITPNVCLVEMISETTFEIRGHAERAHMQIKEILGQID